MRAVTAAIAAALVLVPAAPAWAANSAPVAGNDSQAFSSTAPVPTLVHALTNDSDPDGDTLVVTAVTAATKGRTSIESGQLFYTPNSGHTGPDTFTYTVSDPQGNTATATVHATLWLDPGAPDGVAISASGTSSATLTWTAPAGAAFYRIHRNGVDVAGTSALSFTDDSLLANGSYQYEVVALNGGNLPGPASPSVYRIARLGFASGLTVDITEDPTALSLTWKATTRTGYWNVYRDDALLTTSPSASLRDTGLVTGRPYSYQVQFVASSTTTAVYPPSLLSPAVSGTPVVLTDIGRLFLDHGGNNGVYGPVTVPEHAVPGGRQEDHVRAVLVQRDGEGPRAVTAASMFAYLDEGGAAGDLGFPLTDQECGLRDGGCVQVFDGGSVWAARWGIYVVRPDIEDGWAATGGEEGPLGYPTGSQVTLRDGGIRQRFEHGWAFFTDATGSHGVSGSIADYYGLWQYQDSFLGYPITDMTCGLRGGGCEQAFHGGYIHWSPTTGAQVTSGPILTAWQRQGWQNGALGYPTRVAVCGLRGGGCWQAFQGGDIHWSPTTGAQITTGAFLTAWSRQGAQNGALGYPTTGATCGLRAGGCLQRFQHGYIHWTPTTGAQVTTGAFLTAWSRAGAQNGRLGYPTTGATVSRGVARQSFQGGVITVDTAGRARITYR